MKSLVSKEIATIEELKKVQLEIIEFFHNYCKENNLKYYLWGGTLLGAIRHDGYIPWDDDIDVAMPRKDYELLSRTFQHEKYEFFTCENNKKYPFAYGKMCDQTTLKKENVYTKLSLGIDIDIFPIDDVGDYDEIEKMTEKRLRTIRKWSIGSSVYAGNKKSFKQKLKAVTKSIIATTGRTFGVLNPNRVARKLNKMGTDPKGDNKDLILFADTNLKRNFYMKKEWCDEVELHKFEHLELNIMKGWHDVLVVSFGDYMKLPPEEQRVAHHSFTAFYK